VSEPDTVRYCAKAYPSLCQLEVLNEIGDNSILASISRAMSPTRTTTAIVRPFRDPGHSAIIERLREQSP
jgi:hypothetical protein